MRISPGNAFGQRYQTPRVRVTVDFLLQTFSQNDAPQMPRDALKKFLAQTTTLV